VSALRAAPRIVALRAIRHAADVDLARPHLAELTRWLQEPVTEGELRLPEGRAARLRGDRITLTRAEGGDPMKKDE
jgi:hypothetical protein